MNSKKSLTLGALALTLVLSAYISFAFAGVGGIRIDPPLPYMNESPAAFTVYVQPPDDANEPYILLVMTEESYNSLTGDVRVDYDGGWVTITGWTMETDNSVEVPYDELDEELYEKVGYQVASLQDHLDTDGPIYWSIAPIFGGSAIELGKTYGMTITLPSSDPKMLVYVIGKSYKKGSDDYNMRIPPTEPGFVVPEVPLGTVLTLATMLGTAGVYKLRKVRVRSP